METTRARLFTVADQLKTNICLATPLYSQVCLAILSTVILSNICAANQPRLFDPKSWFPATRAFMPSNAQCVVSEIHPKGALKIFCAIGYEMCIQVGCMSDKVHGRWPDTRTRSSGNRLKLKQDKLQNWASQYSQTVDFLWKNEHWCTLCTHSGGVHTNV